MCFFRGGASFSPYFVACIHRANTRVFFDCLVKNTNGKKIHDDYMYYIGFHNKCNEIYLNFTMKMETSIHIQTHYKYINHFFSSFFCFNSMAAYFTLSNYPLSSFKLPNTLLLLLLCDDNNRAITIHIWCTFHDIDLYLRSICEIEC